MPKCKLCTEISIDVIYGFPLCDKHATKLDKELDRTVALFIRKHNG